MGITHVTVTVSNLIRDREPYEADFLVDTDAIHCRAAREALENSGIQWDRLPTQKVKIGGKPLTHNMAMNILNHQEAIRCHFCPR